jgi:hypothetical protein
MLIINEPITSYRSATGIENDKPIPNSLNWRTVIRSKSDIQNVLEGVATYSAKQFADAKKHLTNTHQ